MSLEKALKKLKKQRIVVTGANGFIGSNLCDYLSSRGFDIYPILGPGTNPANIKGKKLDLTDFDSFKKYFKRIKPDIVIHLGAFVNLARDFEVGLTCVDTNMKGTLHVLEASQLVGVKKVLFFSSYALYGRSKIPYKETQLPKPPSVYSITKVACENLCSLYKDLYGLDYTVLRISNVYGPYQNPARVLPSIILNVSKGCDVQIASGKNKRDFLFMEDALEAIVLSAVSKKARGEIINIASGKTYTIRELAKNVIELMNSEVRILVNKVPSRKGESPEMRSSTTKAKKLLGWTSKTSLKEGLKKTINYYAG